MNYQKFAEIPFVYDLIQFLFGKPIVDKKLKTQIESFQLDHSAYILDLGGGTGLNRKLLTDTNHYICLDLDFEKIVSSLHKTAGNNSLLADACKIPLQDHSIDLILLTSVTHHIPDSALPILFKEMQRAMKPSAYLLLIDPVIDKKNLIGRFFLRYDLGAFPRSRIDLYNQLSEYFTTSYKLEFRLIHSYLLFSGIPIKRSGD